MILQVIMITTIITITIPPREISQAQMEGLQDSIISVIVIVIIIIIIIIIVVIGIIVIIELSQAQMQVLQDKIRNTTKKHTHQYIKVKDKLST